jgi:hypothetical protein
MTNDLSYPIGRFETPARFDAAARRQWIDDVARTPEWMRAAVKGLDESRLDAPYRPGGWTVRQVVHHVPDSHLNAYVRFKLALTENEPTIKPYDEGAWATMEQGRTGAIEPSLGLLEHLHTRWVDLMRAMQPSDFARRLVHPEHPEPRTLDWMLAQYAWHGRHHTAHITALRSRMGW